MDEIKRASTFLKIVRIFCVAAFVLLLFFPIISGRFGLETFNGVANALQFGICLLLIRIDEKKGVILASILMGISAITTIVAMLTRDPLMVLPGLANIIFYFATILITAKANRKREIEKLTDMLTGIYNRRGLFKYLGELVVKDNPFHLIYLSLENFKAINDNYGQLFGDELLREVSRRIAGHLSKNATVARISGTEFVVVLDSDTESDARALAENILETLRKKATLVVSSVSIECFLKCYAGIASYPEHSDNFKDIITYADIAMVEATGCKSKEAVVFENSMAKAVHRQIEVENLIKEGLEKDYFYLVYQPQYYLDRKRLRGFETLIRMRTPDGSFVSPGEFIPVAEKGDLILQIDDYVLNRAMKEFKQVVEDNPKLTISINVSAKNIGRDDFVETISQILDNNQFPAGNLEIEITEYCMVNSIEVTKANIFALKAMGIQIALDDFGTGYTSLNYLSELPINLLKIDKSLIDDIENSAKRREFVQIIVSMGHLMDCEVISEGVEQESQVDILKHDGCDFIQGYVWGRPLDYQVAKQLSYEQ